MPLAGGRCLRRRVRCPTDTRRLHRAHGRRGWDALRSFQQKTLGRQTLVSGNVAVVLAASEMLEIDTEVNHGVSG